jgi:hypothetical protein
MATTNDTFFVLEPENGGTKVTWRMTGTNNFVAKAFGVVMNMDQMVGGDFEKGLSSLKALAEAAAEKAKTAEVPPPAPDAADAGATADDAGTP